MISGVMSIERGFYEVHMRLLAIVVLLAPLAVFAQHQHDHGDHPHDLGNIGKAHFATSCSEAAQKEIDRGVALMHSFWYPEAEKAFRRAAAADAECGMAWWGVAMANVHPIWPAPTPDERRTGTSASEKAMQIGAKTDREKAYIGAIHAYFATSDPKKGMADFEAKMAEVEAANPKDREAAIFHALTLLGTADPKDKTYGQQKKAAAILNRVLPEEPEHPGVAHYLIHSFDYPELAELALPAARVYAKLAPGSPHALHMPSHIFTRLGLWEESIASNLASEKKAATHAALRDELHAVDYLAYAYLQLGRIDEAKKLVDKVAKTKRIDDASNFAGAYAVSTVPARFALERRQWKEAAALTVPSTVAWDKFPYAEANIHFARAIGGARSGNLDVARDAVARLTTIQKSLTGYWADQVEIQRLAGAAWLAHASGEREDALKLMRDAADLEATTEKHPVTPGALTPARELLAEMLLDAGKKEEALAAVELVLKDAPNRRNALALRKR
jgi:tetratricopeptide (TPR) repeat protein